MILAHFGGWLYLRNARSQKAEIWRALSPRPNKPNPVQF